MTFDRAAIMRRAHRDYRFWRRAASAHCAPRPFGDCLAGAWAVAKLARATGSMKYAKAA